MQQFAKPFAEFRTIRTACAVDVVAELGLFEQRHHGRPGNDAHDVVQCGGLLFEHLRCEQLLGLLGELAYTVFLRDLFHLRVGKSAGVLTEKGRFGLFESLDVHRL